MFLHINLLTWIEVNHQIKGKSTFYVFWKFINHVDSFPWLLSREIYWGSRTDLLPAGDFKVGPTWTQTWKVILVSLQELYLQRNAQRCSWHREERLEGTPGEGRLSVLAQGQSNSSGLFCFQSRKSIFYTTRLLLLIQHCTNTCLLENVCQQWQLHCHPHHYLVWGNWEGNQRFYIKSWTILHCESWEDGKEHGCLK